MATLRGSPPLAGAVGRSLPRVRHQAPCGEHLRAPASRTHQAVSPDRCLNRRTGVSRLGGHEPRHFLKGPRPPGRPPTPRKARGASGPRLPAPQRERIVSREEHECDQRHYEWPDRQREDTCSRRDAPWTTDTARGDAASTAPPPRATPQATASLAFRVSASDTHRHDV